MSFKAVAASVALMVAAPALAGDSLTVEGPAPGMTVKLLAVGGVCGAEAWTGETLTALVQGNCVDFWASNVMTSVSVCEREGCVIVSKANWAAARDWLIAHGARQERPKETIK
jgi:hypothetical protein